MHNHPPNSTNNHIRYEECKDISKTTTCLQTLLLSHNYKMIIRATLNFINKKITKHIVRAFTTHTAQTTYVQRPFLTQRWLTEKATLKDALHNSWLMAKGVIPFSYDAYEWACSKAITNQAQLTKQDMFMLIRLGIQYRVRLSPFCNHVENEIFLRIHRDYELQMQDYDEQIKAELKAMYDKLESKSKDYFNLLSEEMQQEDEQASEDELQSIKQDVNIPQFAAKVVSESETEKLMQQLTDKLRQRKQKEFSLEDLVKVSQYLREWNSRNLQMIQYLQQLLTIKLQTQKVEADTALSYLKFLTYACQTLKLQYEQNKQKYTTRSIKRIYKYQYFYFQQHFRQLITSDATATPQFVEEIIKQYAAFPIKRREIRRKIGIYVGSQMQKFNMLQRNDLTALLVNLNGKDQKIKRTYRQLLHLPEPQPEKKEIAEKIQNQQSAKTEQQQQSQTKK